MARYPPGRFVDYSVIALLLRFNKVHVAHTRAFRGFMTRHAPRYDAQSEASKASEMFNSLVTTSYTLLEEALPSAHLHSSHWQHSHPC